MRALVIDDSRAVRLIIGGTLRELGIDVVEAGDGREALDRLARHPDIGLIVVDWNMPVMNGLEVIQAVRAEPAYRGVKIVMATTETESEQMSRALAAGADEYVMKPFTREVLIAKLRMLDVIEE